MSPLHAAQDEDQEEAQRRQRRQRLMQRIEAQPDFATIKASMLEIQRVARSDRSHARELAGLIHDDPAVQGKLLRLINAAFYKSAGAGQITSMQKAVTLMGFHSVGLLAGSLMLFERLDRGANGPRLKQEFARAQLAALLAQDLCPANEHSEHVYMATLFQRLGDMVAGLHLAEEIQVIDDTLDDRELAPHTRERDEAREQLTRAQWGMSLEELGIEVARLWGWPQPLIVGMRSLGIDDPIRELRGVEYMRGLCTAANRLADVLMHTPLSGSAEERAEARKALVRRCAADWAVPLALNLDTLPERVEATRAAWEDLMKTLGVTPGSQGSGNAPDAAPSNKPKPGTQQYRQALALELADAVDHLTRMNRRSAPAAEVSDSALRLMSQALGLQRAILCLRDAETGRLKGRSGIGDKGAVLAAYFDIEVQPPADLFGLLCCKNADTLISDATEPLMAQRLPEWFHRRVKAGSFLVLPLGEGGQVLGMLYGDQREPHQLHVHERALTLLRNLRGQVLQAIAREHR